MLTVAADLPDSFVRLLPDRLEVFEKRCERVAEIVGRDAGDAGLVHRVHDLAEHVELQLVGGPVADAHRTRPTEPLEPVELELGQPPLTAEAVHDLQLVGVPGAGSQQPVAPVCGLGAEPGLDERIQRERRISQPAVAVVPVPGPARGLGQRGGRRRDDRAGRGVGEALEYDGRRRDFLGPGPVVGDPVGPLAPTSDRVVERSVDGIVDGDRRRRRVLRLEPREVEPGTGALTDLEVGDGRQPFTVDVDAGTQHQRVGSPDGKQVVVGPAHPRHDSAVTEPDAELHPHRHSAAGDLDLPEQARGRPVMVGHGQRVGHHGGPVRRRVRRLQDERAGKVPPFGAELADGADREVTVLLGTDECCHRGRGVEAGEGQPVDAARSRHHRRRTRVGEERVVLDPRRRHMRLTVPAPCHDGPSL